VQAVIYAYETRLVEPTSSNPADHDATSKKG
jgi:hypothetical protein